MSLVSWLILACLAQSVSAWSSLSRLEVISFTAKKTSPTRPDNEKRNTKAATSLSFIFPVDKVGLRRLQKGSNLQPKTQKQNRVSAILGINTHPPNTT